MFFFFSMFKKDLQIGESNNKFYGGNSMTLISGAYHNFIDCKFYLSNWYVIRISDLITHKYSIPWNTGKHQEFQNVIWDIQFIYE